MADSPAAIPRALNPATSPDAAPPPPSPPAPKSRLSAPELLAALEGGGVALEREPKSAFLQIVGAVLEARYEEIRELERRLEELRRDAATRREGDGQGAARAGLDEPLTFEIVENREEAYELLRLAESSTLAELDDRFRQELASDTTEKPEGIARKRRYGAILALALQRSPPLPEWTQSILFAEARKHIQSLQLPATSDGTPPRLNAPQGLGPDPRTFSACSTKAAAFSALGLEEGATENAILAAYKRKRSAAGAVVTLSLAHPDFKELERKLRTIILGKAMACVLDLNLALRSAEAKRFGAVVEDIENQVLRFWNNAAKAKSLSPDKKTKMGWLEIALSKARAEVASKARELDSSRSTMNGLRVKMGVLENKLREAESRDVEDGRTASSVEARSTEELAGELGRLTRMVWGIEEEKERGGQLRMKLEDKCTSLRSELEQVRREFEAKNETIVNHSSLSDVSQHPRHNTAFVVARLAEQVKVLNAALLRTSLESTDLLVRLGAGEA